MTTENILLNSPALKSLKRAQLVGLCKRYGLRANGKNTELIARLQEYGRSGAMAGILGPKCDVNDQGEEAGSPVETNGDDDDDCDDKRAPEPRPDSLPAAAPRPSEAWSVVDEPVDVGANMPGGLPAIYEFGDGDKDSKKSSSVSSSFKLLAASLFAGSSARSKASVPPSVVASEPPVPPLVPDTTMTFLDAERDESDVEMELNTSVSTILKGEIDLGASTIRLVAPAKKSSSASPPSSPEYANPSPFKGKSQLSLPSSSSQLHLPLVSSSTANLFSTSTSRNFSKSTPPELLMGSKPLYPSLNPSVRSMKTMTSDSFSIPGTFPEPPARSYPAYAFPSPKGSEPPVIPTNMNPDFTFRSPMPKAANADKGPDLARAAVLAEMRRRMAEEPTATTNAALGEFSFVAVPAAAGGGAKKRSREDEHDETSETRAGASAPSIAAKFDKTHRKQFDKMASIADHYATRRPNPSPRKSNAGGRLSSNGYPRARTSLINNRGGRWQSTTALRLSAARAATARPSTSNPGERPGKRARISSANVEEGPTTIKPEPTETVPTPSTAQVRISEPENRSENVDLTAETKRKIDAASANARARRKSRSSLGRQSLSRNAILGSHPPPKPKGLASRFGFLKTPAKLVKSMYTSVIGGGSTSTKNDAPSAKLKKKAAPPTALRTTTTAQSSKPVSGPSASASRRSSAQSRPYQAPAPSTRPLPMPEGSAVQTTVCAPNARSIPHGISRKASSSSRPGIPAWNNPPKLERTGTSAIPPAAGSISSSSRLSRTPSLGAASTLRSEMSLTTAGTTPASSIGLKGSSSIRSSNSFAAPTISSLARASAKAKTLGQANAQSVIRSPSISSRAALLGSVPEHRPAAAVPETPRAGTASPNKYGFVGRASTSPQKPIATSRFVLSPNSAVAKQSTNVPRPPTVSPNTAPGSHMASPGTQNVQSDDTFVLSPRENVSFSALQADVNKTKSDAPAPLLPRSTSNASSVRTSSAIGSLRKRPRISRSKVIAKLDQKRAAEDSSNMLPAPSARIKQRTRSSVGVGLASKSEGLRPDAKMTRRSFVTSGISGSPRATSGLVRKERAALESFQRGQRKSEASARLKRSSQGLVPLPRTIAEQGEDG